MWKKFVFQEKQTDYSVSDDGYVRKDTTNYILSQSTQQGYRMVTLLIDGKQKRMRVHRLVALTFIPNEYPIEKPYVNHIDGDRSNNMVSNLEWVSPSENIQKAADLGRMGKRARPVVQYTLDGEKVADYQSATKAAQENNIQQSKITLCCQRQRKSTGDYQWRYAGDESDIKPIQKKYFSGIQVAQCDQDWNIIAIYPSFAAAARAVHGEGYCISQICHGVRQHHKGYRWKLVDEIVQE